MIFHETNQNTDKKSIMCIMKTISNNNSRLFIVIKTPYSSFFLNALLLAVTPLVRFTKPIIINISVCVIYGVLFRHILYLFSDICTKQAATCFVRTEGCYS